jgi:hypothetical protein
VTLATPKASVPPSTIASARDRLADIEENFMAVPFIDPAILLCQSYYAPFFNSSVR